MKDKKADIIAVAKAAKVSPSTVSRSFNHPEMVKAATRKKIDAAVRRLGYIRNRAAQTIHGIRSGTVGLVVPTIDHTIFAELIQSFSQAVEELGFTILLASHGYDLDREYALTRKMLEHRVDGVALIGLDHAPDTFALLDEQSTPSILLWSFSENAPLPCAGADNFEAGAIAAQHVVDLGHDQVALLFPPLSDNDRAGQRNAGVVTALKSAGIDPRPEWSMESRYGIASAKQAIRTLLDQKERPTALICGNDVLAWGAIHAARLAGVDVPQQLTIVGIGDFSGSQDFEPALSTVSIPAKEIGRQGAGLIASSITNPDGVQNSCRVDLEMRVRATCGPNPRLK